MIVRAGNKLHRAPAPADSVGAKERLAVGSKVVLREEMDWFEAGLDMTDGDCGE